ncbi:MAG: hypothetical protein AB2L14_26970 [Candidatus Xenobiia bacterium LiM19]
MTTHEKLRGETLQPIIGCIILFFLVIAVSAALSAKGSDSTAGQPEERAKLTFLFRDCPAVQHKSVSISFPRDEKFLRNQANMKGTVTVISSLSPIHALAFDEADNLWAGTESGAVTCGENGLWTLYNTLCGLAYHRITSLLAAPSGLFMGASPLSPVSSQWGGTLMRYDTKEKSVLLFGKKQGFTAGRVNCLLPCDNLLYIGTDNGLSFLDIAHNRIIYAREAMNVQSLTLDGSRLLVEVRSGLPRSNEILDYNLETKISTKAEASSVLGFDILASSALHGDRLWLTGYNVDSKGKKSPQQVSGGLKYYDLARKKLFTADIPKDVYRDRLLVREAGGSLWLLSDEGFGVIKDLSVEFYRIPELRGNAAPCLVAKSGKGEIWMASPSQLMRFSPAKIECCDFTNSLSDNFITAMITAHGALWAGTSSGYINKISPSGKVERIYGEKDGLKGQSVTELFRDSAGVLYARFEASIPSSSYIAGKGSIMTYAVYAPGEDRWNAVNDMQGIEKFTDLQSLPHQYSILTEKLRLETGGRQSLFLEDRSSVWVSNYGSGLLRVEK